MHTLHTYLPQDRLDALCRGIPLPVHDEGSALFADISGFTQLTEAITQQLGPWRGAEEVSRQINAVYDTIITATEQYGGSVLSFAGDAITCWFTGDDGLRAVAAAQTLQALMKAFPTVGMKVAVTQGAARRLVVGDPDIQCFDAMAGATIARLAAADQLATRGEVLVDAALAHRLAAHITPGEWRTARTGDVFAVVQSLTADHAELQAALQATLQAACCRAADAGVALSPERLRPWILPPVFKREQSGHGAFLTELRPAVALFLRFTGINYDVDEQAEARLDALIRRTQAVVTRYEGNLLQLNIGDKGSFLYAVFGAPIAHEEDAHRAVQAALVLRTAAAELDFLAPVQIGISQGTMRAGAYGGATRRTYGVLGDDVNVAARLMTAAHPGEILISKQIQKAVEADFVLKAYAAPMPIKGKVEPIPVFAVLGRRNRRAIRLEEPHYTLPMMGRQAELALIADRLEAARQGRGQVIGITAEAGMGKSRLVAEVIHLALQRGFTGYGGACEASGLNTPYLVWKPIWQALLDVESRDPLPLQIRRLESKLQTCAPSRVAALPVLSPLLDIPIEDTDFTRTLEPKDRRNVLTATVEECLKSAAQSNPLLLVLEDLHWIDALSHDLLETLTRLSAGLPICFILAYRPPETLRRQASRIESLPHFTRVALTQLAEAEAEQLIRAKLEQLFPTHTGALPPDLAAQLTARAANNPFYIEELLNYLHDHRINPYAAGEVATLELPVSLHALILSRIDRLSESQKVALKTASIIGRVFSLSWLHGYYPALGALERVKNDLAELARLDLTPLDTPEPELIYLFKHIVTREVAYSSLTYADKAQLHAQLARFIETLGPDRYLDLLAFHYSQSDNQAKQREYLQKAGEAAQAAFANEAALDYFTRLLSLLEEPCAQLDLYLRRGAVRELAGQWPEAEADYRAALALGERTQLPAAAIARCQRMLGKILRLRGDYAAALTWLEPARATLAAQEERADLVLTLTEIGSVKWRQGDYVGARADLELGLALAQALDDRPGAAVTLNILGIVAYLEGNFGAARELYEKSLALCREMDNKQGIAIALADLGIAAYEQSDYGAALALFEESLALYRMMSDKQGIAMILANMGIMAHKQGNYANAHTLQEESLLLFQEMGAKEGAAISLNSLGNLAIAQGDLAAAQAAYSESLCLLYAMSDKRNMVYSLSGLAAVAAASHAAQRAAQLAAVAETLRASVGMAWESIEAGIYERTVATARGMLDAAEFNAAWQVGAQMALEKAVAYALEKLPLWAEPNSTHNGPD